jgi:glycosyltransferase involved in cell wall biosynthesis
VKGASRRLRLAFELLRAEGPRGHAERLAERVETLSTRLEETAVPLERFAEAAGQVRVLDVLASPLAPRWGGVPTQLLARRAEEERLWPTALVAPEAGRWTLRVTRQGTRLRTRLGPCGDVARSGWVGGGPGADGRDAVATVVEAARLVGAEIVNVEGAAGWPLAALRALAGREPRLVVSLHDFALFCPRPNLVEEPQARFCGYSTDGERCRVCLAATWRLPPGFLEAWRREATELLAAAHAIVYPSSFLLARHATLFPGPRGGLEQVIEPVAPGGGTSAPAPATRAVGREGPARVAFVGAFRPHKGARVFRDLVTRREVAGRPVEWSILGSGDAALSREVRGSGVRVAGHYRAGSLARRLQEEDVDVALLLSVWPETYSLTLTECRAAGVPVLAFGHGAIAERIAAEGGGLVVPVENGAEAIAGMLEKVLSGELAVPPFRGGPAGPSARGAAAARSRLYRTLLGEAT